MAVLSTFLAIMFWIWMFRLARGLCRAAASADAAYEAEKAERRNIFGTED